MKNFDVDTSKTFIDTLHIVKFRSFENVEINIGRKLTMISGLNGTGKSTILGILAQICGFTKDYTPRNNEVNIQDVSHFKTIHNQPFTSNFNNHFKISREFDLPNADNYTVKFKINDAGEKVYTDATLRGTKRSTKRDELLRLVLRKETTIASNASRNVTFPTIFLSLRRLTPFVNRHDNVVEPNLSSNEQHEFKKLTNDIFSPAKTLTEFSSNEDGQSGVNSTVVTGENYNIESASTGEDNIGQIVGAMISFMRLKNNWAGYHGGLLLIDELDASIFPYSQKMLLKVLRTFSSKYKVQVIFTTHSDIIMKEMLNFKKTSKLNAKTSADFGINFLSNEYGSPANHPDYSFQRMFANLNLEDYSSQSEKINCYCEDEEAYLFLRTILDSKLKKKLKLMTSVNVGGNQLIALRKNHIPEFYHNAIVVLDGDKKISKKSSNFIKLPSPMPPDQLMFKLLSDLPADDSFWKNAKRWDKLIFNNNELAKNITSDLVYNTKKNCYEFKQELNYRNNSIPVRDYFKKWFHQNKEKLRLVQNNPIRQIWINNNLEKVSKFKDEFSSAINFVQRF